MKNRTGFICGHRLRRSLSSGHARTNINPPDANIYIHVMNIILLPSIQRMSCKQNKRPNVRRQPLDSIVFGKRYVLHCTRIIINI